MLQQTVQRISLIFFLMLPLIVHAQLTAEEQAVRQVVDQLFVAMWEADSSKAAQVFHPSARLFTAANDASGNPVLQTTVIADFVKTIGSLQAGRFKEDLTTYDIFVDDNLGTVWATYSFYVDGVFSHCGVDAFQLCKTTQGWKIVQIIDTRRKTNCYQGKG